MIYLLFNFSPFGCIHLFLIQQTLFVARKSNGAISLTVVQNVLNVPHKHSWKAKLFLCFCSHLRFFFSPLTVTLTSSLISSDCLSQRTSIFLWAPDREAAVMQTQSVQRQLQHWSNYTHTHTHRKTTSMHTLQTRAHMQYTHTNDVSTNTQT